MIIGKYHCEKSLNGFSLDDIKSALQKYIRRGEIEKSIFFAGEFDLFKDADCRQEIIRTNFIHRLMIIFLEDVGNLNGLKFIDKQIYNLLEERKKTNRNKYIEETWICEIVNFMCLSKKTRLPSHLRSFYSGKYVNLAEEFYPSLKKDTDIIKNFNNLSFDELCYNFKISLQDKKLISIFWAFKINESDVKLSGKKKKPVYKIFEILKTFLIEKKHETIFIILLKWYDELKNTKESFLTWLNLILLVIEKKHITYLDYVNCPITNFDKNRLCKQGKEKLFKVDEFVFDIHTKKNKNLNSIDFALCGSIVIPESTETISLFENFYKDTKRIDNNVLPNGEFQIKSINHTSIYTSGTELPFSVDNNKITHHNLKIEYTKNLISQLNSRKNKKEHLKLENEKDIFTFIIRTQLTTSNYKTDVYIGKKDNKLYVIKGPLSENSVETYLKIKKWKLENDLPVIPSYDIKMFPDRWLEGVPLGIRNNLDKNKKAPFLVFDSLLEEKDIIIKKHKSKLWPETEVIDWSKINSIKHIKINEMNEDEIKQYIENLCFRYIFGIGDLADRNFIIHKGIVYSIDEDTVKNEVNFMNELKKNKCNFISNWINENFDKLNIHKWKFTCSKHINKHVNIANKTNLINLFK